MTLTLCILWFPSGNIGIMRVQKLMSMARIGAYHIPNEETGNTFLEYDKLTSGLYTFLASVQTEVSRDFYSILQEASFPKLEMFLHLGHIGSSSLNSVCCLRDPDTGREFARNTNTVVTVDKSTRKPTKILDWWREKYESCVIGNQKLQVAPLQRPSETSNYQVKVPWRDVDGYKHTNYLSYISFSLDAAMDGLVQGRFAKFHGDIYNYHVKKLQVLYKNETLAGDLLDIGVWENEEDPYLLHFDTRKDDNTVFQCSIEFYEPEEAE